MLVRIIVILSFDPLCKQNRLLPVANWDIHAYVSVFIRQRERFGLILGFYKYEYRFIVIHAPYICRGSLTRYDHVFNLGAAEKRVARVEVKLGIVLLHIAPQKPEAFAGKDGLHLPVDLPRVILLDLLVDFRIRIACIVSESIGREQATRQHHKQHAKRDPPGSRLGFPAPINLRLRRKAAQPRHKLRRIDIVLWAAFKEKRLAHRNVQHDRVAADAHRLKEGIRAHTGVLSRGRDLETILIKCNCHIGQLAQPSHSAAIEKRVQAEQNEREHQIDPGGQALIAIPVFARPSPEQHGSEQQRPLGIFGQIERGFLMQIVFCVFAD